MKERNFQGMLNSKSVYGQSYSDYSVLRVFKYNKISILRDRYNPLWIKWYKKNKLLFPSWSKKLWNFHGGITYSQRMENLRLKGKDKRVGLFRWKKT